MPRHAVMVLGHSPCTRTRGLALLSCARVGSSSAGRAACVGQGRSVGSRNWVEVQPSPSPFHRSHRRGLLPGPGTAPVRVLVGSPARCLQPGGRGGWHGVGGDGCAAVPPTRAASTGSALPGCGGATASALLGSHGRVTPLLPTSLPGLLGRHGTGTYVNVKLKKPPKVILFFARGSFGERTPPASPSWNASGEQ